MNLANIRSFLTYQYGNAGTIILPSLFITYPFYKIYGSLSVQNISSVLDLKFGEAR